MTSNFWTAVYVVKLLKALSQSTRQLRMAFHNLIFINEQICHFLRFDCYLDNIISGHKCHPSDSKCADTGALRPLFSVDFHIKVSRDD